MASGYSDKHHIHPWNITVREAVEIQRSLAGKPRCAGMPRKVQIIAGVDMAFEKNGVLGFCAVILLTFPDLVIINEYYAHGRVDFPYVPGLLSFREGPLFLKTYSLVKKHPDIIIFDGQGIAHPRRLGIAAHMGLFLDRPAIGCAKSRLCGAYTEPEAGRGAMSFLHGSDGDVIGIVLRTRDNVKPVFVSPGNRIGIRESADMIMRCTGKYRIPEPTRIAHIRVEAYKKEFSK